MACCIIPPGESRRQRRPRPWCGLTAAGGLLLASTFFMPAVDGGCNSPVIPAHEVANLLCNPPHGVAQTIAGLAGVFGLFTVAYLLGLCVALAAMARILRARRGRRERGWAAFTLGELAALDVIGSAVVDAFDRTSSTDWNWLAWLALSLSVVLLVWLVLAVRRLQQRAYLAVTFATALCASLWFSYWVAWGGYYGVRLSFAGSLAMLIGIVGEAKHVTRQTWVRTVWLLLTCRIRDAAIVLSACPGCDYDLHGVAEMRCPECGRPFTLEELELTAAELGLGTVLGAEARDALPKT